ncbi:flippase [Candidatus Woesearchaeota archaeon]|nr:flippase [Candidatus Woesearchaeota archaeon]
MKTAQRIVKNTGILFAGLNINKVITLFLTIVIARYLGNVDFGKFAFAISFTGLFIVLTDIGMRIFIKREVARDLKRADQYLSNVLAMKVVLTFVTLIVVYCVALLLQYATFTIFTILIAVAIMVFQSFNDSIDMVYQAFERMDYSAGITIARTVIRFGLVIVAVLAGMSFVGILLMFLASSIISLIISLIVFTRRFSSLSFEIDFDFLKDLIRKSIPFGVAAMFMTIYAKVDVTMISKLVLENTDAVIGWYSAAHTLIDGLQFIPVAIAAAIEPIAARAFEKSIPTLKKIYTNTFRILIILSFPIVLGTHILAEKIILLIYGPEFMESAIALQALIWMMLFHFHVFTYGLVLNSMNKEKLTMFFTIIAVLVNITLNLILIPQFSFIGAGIATIFSEFSYFILGYIYISKKFLVLNIIKYIYKPIIATGVMGLFLYYFPAIPVIIQVIVGSVIYFSVLFIIRGITNEDKKVIINLISKRFII